MKLLINVQFLLCSQCNHKMSTEEAPKCIYMRECFHNVRRDPVAQFGRDAGCQSRGFEFAPKLGQHSFRRLTKVIASFVFDQWANSLFGKAASCL